MVIRLSTGLPEQEVAAIKSTAQAESVNVEVKAEPPTQINATPAEGRCQKFWGAFGVPQVVFCDRPLRGGVTIWNAVSGGGICSLGFIVTNGPEEFIMTAGHCRTGGSSDTQCGVVLSTANTVNVGGVITGLLTEDTFCAISGDSGGTVFGNHSGFGMTTAITAECNHPGAKTWYSEAIRSAIYSGVNFYVPHG